MSVAIVTGGGGFLGGKLCRYLLTDGGYSRVIAFDVYHSNNDEDSPAGLKNIKGDICDYGHVFNVITETKPNIVFHLASYGMSGREMLDKKRIEEVNVNGTKNIIKACIASGVHSLVYTSTYNVVFGGQEIRNGNESLPYFPIDKHVDNYSRTKALAEQLVLKSNGSELENGKGHLSVCSLRCAGIYGEGERRHLPRVVLYIERGLFCFTYGSKDSLVDFLHWDNFVLAHYLAANKLLHDPIAVAGKPYFISDGNPINNFIFFKPLVEGLGHSFPTIRLPLSVVYYTAFLIEVVHGIFGRYVYNFQPLFTRAEVFKTGVTHYFRVDAAKSDFGYEPKTKDFRTVVKWFKDHSHDKKKRRKSGYLWSSFLAVFVGCVICFLLLSLLPIVH